MHDDPEGRAFAQPRHDVAARARRSGPARLAHHARANDDPHERHAVVAADLSAETRIADNPDISHEKVLTERPRQLSTLREANVVSWSSARVNTAHQSQRGPHGGARTL